VSAAAAPAGWRGHLTLNYRLAEGKTACHDAHTGPLRVLQALYPEGPAICHHVLVHPPGGVVGGDELIVDATLAPGTHALVTTPGATRFYRSEGATALQQATLRIGAGARLEWLPMETIAYSGCLAQNRVCATLAPSAEMIGWDVLALGLAAAGQPFVAGHFRQHLELPGVWLESARIAANDAVLREHAAGWAGHAVLATLWFAAGSALAPARRDALLDAARGISAEHPLAATSGTTAPQGPLVVLRALAPRVEPAMQLLVQVRQAWRRVAWGLAGEAPRIWRT
jgi:urease accessory protein